MFRKFKCERLQIHDNWASEVRQTLSYMSAGGVSHCEMPAILSAEGFQHSDCSDCSYTNKALGGLHDATNKLLT